MDAIETLMNEHRTIERVCDGLVGFADELRRKETTEKEELGRFVEFIREFADAWHHGKEENILFETMIDHGFPRHGGPVAVMLHEHGIGRGFVATLASKVDMPGAWSAADRHEVADAATGYAELLREHIHKEDAILYPMAESRLPPDALDRVNERCERYEQERSGSGENERLHALADALVARHARASHPSAGPGPHRHGGGCF
jgi:hemerythrin-like domain-containing protein